MKTIRTLLAIASCVVAFGLSSSKVAAQGQRNFDPAQFRERMIERYREDLDVKDDAEWKVLEGAIGKVMDARMATMSGAGRGLFGGRPRNRGDNAGDNNNGGDNNNRRRGGGPGGFFAPSPEAEALQAAIDAKAPAEEIKSKLAKLREANKAHEAKLESAQEDLRKLLSSRQEAVAVLLGLLK